MTREDIRKHFPDATDDQISALLDINSRDVGKVKTAYENAAAELKTARETIAELEKNAKNAEALQKTLDEFRAAEEKRQADAKAAAERAERLGRFDKAHEEVVKGRKFLNEYTREGVFAQFEKALLDDANKGKSDVQIYTTLTQDEKGIKEGLYQPQVNGSGGYVPPMGGAGGAASYTERKYEKNPFVQQFLMG